MSILHLTILVAKSDVKKISVFTDLKIQARKTYKALAADARMSHERAPMKLSNLKKQLTDSTKGFNQNL